ncbi:MAG: immunoglobulin domain-containing protein, partial [Bacteroidota bacterium]|nr:immunoglobulin domain-containing protein [Bacteroidota bacterium]
GTISGAKTGTLTISGLSLSDAGTYTCEVSGSCGSTVHSDPSNLIVDEHISITTQPLGQSACLGDTRYFSVAATGSNLLYQWQKDGVALTDGANISGSNDKVLVLSSVKASDAGTYNCIITNSCGSLSSNHVDLTINTPVSITSASGDATKCEGDNVNFVVSATGSNLSYQWQYNNTNLSDGGNISGTQTNNLFIQSMTKANAGVYSCIVTGSCGNQVSNSAILRVNEKILITSQPQNTATCLGNNTAFSVSATGSNLSYQWQKDGSGLIAGATNPALTLSNVSASDAGMYSCIVSGSCGSVTSNSASLTVQAPVAITGQPASVEYCEGKNVNFVVSATGTDLTYQWTKDGVTLTDGTKINGSTTNTLTINNIDLIDKGAYTCKVTGTCSYVNSTPANLTVDPTTAIITQPVDFYAVTSGNATFSVTASGASAYQWQ